MTTPYLTSHSRGEILGRAIDYVQSKNPKEAIETAQDLLELVNGLVDKAYKEGRRKVLEEADTEWQIEFTGREGGRIPTGSIDREANATYLYEAHYKSGSEPVLYERKVGGWSQVDPQPEPPPLTPEDKKRYLCRVCKGAFTGKQEHTIHNGIIPCPEDWKETS